jgi:hypothetical protein
MHWKHDTRKTVATGEIGRLTIMLPQAGLSLQNGFVDCFCDYQKGTEGD